MKTPVLHSEVTSARSPACSETSAKCFFSLPNTRFLLLRLSMSSPTKSFRSKGAQRSGILSAVSRAASTLLLSKIQNKEEMKS